jgi:hypothetical protein
VSTRLQGCILRRPRGPASACFSHPIMALLRHACMMGHWQASYQHREPLGCCGPFKIKDQKEKIYILQGLRSHARQSLSRIQWLSRSIILQVASTNLMSHETDNDSAMETTKRKESPQKPGRGWRFYGTFACLALLNLVCAIDATILAVALPVR